MPSNDELQQKISLAHAEALRVGDSPLRADQLADRLAELARGLDSTDLSDDLLRRLRDALAVAERVLRRDDDGREAARHLHTALGLFVERPRRPSPFLDD